MKVKREKAKHSLPPVLFHEQAITLAVLQLKHSRKIINHSSQAIAEIAAENLAT